MFDVLKKSVYASIGLANVTTEKVADMVAEVTKEGELTEQQVEEFKEEVSRRSEEARKELAALIDRQIDHAMIQMKKWGQKKWGHILICDLSCLNRRLNLLSLDILERVIFTRRLIEE